MDVINFRYLITVVFASIFGVFGIYHLISYLVLRHKILFYYFILIFGLTLHWSLSLIIKCSYNDLVIRIADKATLTTAMISTFGLLMFTKSYLNITPNNYLTLSKTYKVFGVIIIGLPILHISNNVITKIEWLNSSLIMFAALMALSTTLLSLFSGIRLYKVEKFNKYYLYCYTPYLIASIVYVVSWFTQKYFNFDGDFVILMTSILVTFQLILFSILISYKYKFIEENTIKIQVDANKKLITEVEKQTKHLKVAKEELEFKNEELEKVNKLKNKLFSLLAHDVRGPLNNIGIIIEMIESQLVESELKEITKKLKNEVSDRISMVNVLLDWSYRQLDGVTLDKKICNLDTLFHLLQKEFKRMADEKSIEIELSISCTELFVDENMLKVILRNLISNAIKFSEKGQKIILSSKCTTEIVEIGVKDFGLGMKTDWQNSSEINSGPKVRQGTTGEKGTGFGLMIVKDFVEMNDGEIQCISEINKGTEFILRFKNSVDVL
ncbi:sensor histidine kinase [Cellulophaga tyrosinoxydans]|uniref:histidine kinase n=1 Tax=Cellulophaga tyrosinoxydans TaxID=504486 RepID=A0A1W2BJ41_9FLAO|nr:sensor histidine kinase [Cellulophaga tyrosinoxydans]SMC72722.1 Signal transduction histidine kinase [Cellulophaga tyrosinoxydans]